MRRNTIILTIFALLLGGLSAVMAPVASAAAQCRFTPVLPAKLAVGQTVVGLTARLKISGAAACADNPDVQTQLVHSTDSFFIWWTDTKPDVESVYAYEIVPGVYRTTASKCDAYDSDFNDLTCSVAAASVTIKFAARPRLTATRSGKSITFKAVATRYFEYDGYQPVRANMIIQRYSQGVWKTVHTAVANGKAGFTYTYANAPRTKYRAVSGETTQAFKAGSTPITR